MKRLYSFLFLIMAITGYSQSKQVWLYTADKFFLEKDYFSALPYYQKILDDTTVLDLKIKPYEVQITNQKLTQKNKKTIKEREVPIDDYTRHQIAVCYKNIFDYDKAAEAFSISKQTGAFPEDEYYLGYANMQLKNYEEAVVSFESYLTNPGKTDSLAKCAEREMIGAFFARDINNVKADVVIKKSDTSVINKGTTSFGAQYWKGTNGLLFTSAREGGILLDPEKQKSEFLCDLYYVEKKGESWSEPKNFGRPVNTGLHEGAGCFTVDEWLYFTRWSDTKKDQQYIYRARMMKDLFFEAARLDTSINKPGYRSIQPYITPDGTRMFFASDRPGGFGGLDIYVAEFDEEGNPVNPVNLGPSVNTPGDEITPFFHLVSSTLFFSSNGHPGIGGLDIFKSSYNPDEEVYSSAVNAGIPFNSEKDDAYFIADRFFRSGYFSSDREECEGGHCYDIYEFTSGPIQISLSGFVYNSETDEIIPNALVEFKDVTGETEPFLIITDENGFYSTPLKQEQELFIKAKKTKFFADASSINTFGITESAALEQDFFLRPIPTGEIEIPGIEYDFDKATLRPKSKEILDQLYDFLQLNDNLIVEIKSHTDCRGNDSYNLTLSQQRAQSCVDYLLAKGINKKRLIPQGYGETEPLFQCDEINALKETDKDKFEELHQRNRRTAFKVLSETNE